MNLSSRQCQKFCKIYYYEVLEPQASKTRKEHRWTNSSTQLLNDSQEPVSRLGSYIKTLDVVPDLVSDGTKFQMFQE